MGRMNLTDLVAAGGAYIVLNAEDGVHVPPGYLIFQCGYGYVRSSSCQPQPKTTSSDAPSFLVPCFDFIRKLLACGLWCNA